MKIGVLALQGAFSEHIEKLQILGVDSREIRKASDFSENLDGLIIPGGESTVMGKLLTDFNLTAPISDSIKNGMPVFGTCAGMILLGSKVEGGQEDFSIKAMNITVVRNAYGRQLGSFSAYEPFGDQGPVPMVFIRAPYISSAADDVTILAKVNDRIVAAQQNRILVTAFHPELTDDLTVHQYFLSQIKEH